MLRSSNSGGPVLNNYGEQTVCVLQDVTTADLNEEGISLEISVDYSVSSWLKNTPISNKMRAVQGHPLLKKVL